MPVVVHINGPINSGKSTIGRRLAESLSDAVFIDGDDHDAPDDAPLAMRIEAALARIEICIEEVRSTHLIIAYPLQEADFWRLAEASRRRDAPFVVVTLAPPLAVALQDRGERRLSEGERARIIDMYEEGYHARSFSKLIVDTSILTPDEAAGRIAAHLPASRC